MHRSEKSILLHPMQIWLGRSTGFSGDDPRHECCREGWDEGCRMRGNNGGLNYWRSLTEVSAAAAADWNGPAGMEILIAGETDSMSSSLCWLRSGSGDFSALQRKTVMEASNIKKRAERRRYHGLQLLGGRSSRSISYM